MLSYPLFVVPTLADANPTLPVITGIVALFMLIGLAVFARIKRRRAEFKQAAEKRGFTVPEKWPWFQRNWRTLATQTDGTWTLEIREERVPRGDDEDYFQELTLRLPATNGLEFLFRPRPRWGSLEPEGEARNVKIGEAEFDRVWFVETNQLPLLRTAFSPELRAHFDGLQQTAGIQRIALKDGLITLRDNRSFLPTERFDHALKIARALATVAGTQARQN